MTIRLPRDLERFVHDAVRSGHYSSDDEVIRDALNRLRHSMPGLGGGHQGKKGQGATRADKKKPLTSAEFDQHLLQIGLMSAIPETDQDFDDPEDEPITVQGEPLSETVIRERR